MATTTQRTFPVAPRVEIAGRVYFVEGDRAEAAVAPQYREIASKITPPFPAAGDKVKLYKSYHESWKVIERRRQELEEFLNAVNRLNGFAGDVQMRSSPRQDASNARVASLPAVRLAAVLAADLERGCLDVIKDFLDTLDYQVESRHVGLIDWEAADVCSFHFYRHDVRTRLTGVRFTDHLHLDFKQTHTRTYHRHDLIAASTVPLPAKEVPQPRRVRRLVRSTPPWLAPFLGVVTGTQIRDLQVLEVIKKKRWTHSVPLPEFVHQWDPALVLGHYVLAGWDESDLERFLWGLLG